MSRHTRYTRNKLALALATALMLPAGIAFAQDQNAEETTENEEEQAEASAVLETMVVTGSRLERSTFTSPSPVQVISRSETTLAGFNSTTGVLQSNAVTGGSDQITNMYGGYVVNGGPGVNTLSLRGLGPTRTLLLLNGRRVSPAGSRGAVGSTDLNVLPNIMIDHIEILKDGASSIYGSDAVAGVVNIITRNRVDGTTFEFQHNATERGGGDETRWSIMSGKTGDNWRISGSLEIYDRNEMTIGDRGWASDCPLPLYGQNPDGTYGAEDYIDPTTGSAKCWTLDAFGVTINTIGTPYQLGRAGLGSLGYYGTYYPGEDVGLPPGLDFFNRWRPNSGIEDGLAGWEGVDYFGRDSFDPRMLNESLISPTRNTTGFLQGGIDVADGDSELYFELLTHRRDSNQVGYRQLSLDYPTGSPLLPESMRDFILAAAPADGSTNGQPIGVRAFIGFGNYDSEQKVDFYRATGGLRGSLSSEWNYDFSLSRARSSATYMIESFLTDRYARSLDVVSDGNGGFVCRDPSGGCVAAPPLSSDVVGGRLPMNYVNWIFQPTYGKTLYTETTATFGVNGPLFDMPHGTVQAAFGLEYRRSEIDDTPDPNSIANNLYGLTASQITRGSDSVKEAYAEIEVPLLSAVTGAEELTMNVSGRWTDYDSYGDDTTYKLGLLWTPINSISLRASYGTSYRAPALFEQYLGATTGFTSSSGDPCNDYGSLPDASPVRANCAAEGLPENFQQNSSITVATRGGAETGLAAETSEALTAGIVFQPEFPDAFGDLSFAADYYDIQVDNGVARLSGGQILSLCYNSISSDFSARNGYCSLVTRAANNTLSVTSGYVNIAIDKVRGWDFTTRYTRDIGEGTFRATAQVSHYLEQSGKTFPDDPLVDSNDRYYAPDLTGQLDLAYSWRKWNFRYGVDWVGSTDEYGYYDEFAEVDYRPYYQMAVDSYHVSNIAVQYRSDDWSITGGVRNLADRDPPVVSSALVIFGNAPFYSGYDFLGRSYYMNITKTF